MNILSKLDIATGILDQDLKKFLFGMFNVDVVAAAGSTQTDATALTSGKNIVTGADGTKGVALPKAINGAKCEIVNSVSNQTLNVYAAVGEQINSILTTSAFALTAGGTSVFHCDANAHWYVAVSNATGTTTTATTNELNVLHSVTAGTAAASSALVLGASKNVDTLGIALVSVGTAGIETGLTAHSGGTQAAALALSATKSVHEVTTVGAGNDSVALPAATGSGVVHFVKNSAAANSMQLFAATPSTIDGVASATGVAVAAGKGRLLVDADAGNWISVAGA